MLEAAGKRVHVYTSPHLVRFNERIAVPGADGIARPIPEDKLLGYLARVEAINAGDPITFFEVTTAAAFLAFAELPADAVLLEVGLGGEYDSTNVVDRPAMCIITPIAMDHAEKLGRRIAHDRSGQGRHPEAGRASGDLAARAGGARGDSPAGVARSARRLKIWGEDFEAFAQRGRLVYQGDDEVLDLPLPALIGRHQVVNAGAAIAAARQLRGLGLTEQAIERGLVEVCWPARMQRLAGGRLAERLTGRKRALARWRPQSALRPSHCADARRYRGACAEAAGDDRRHDGPEGREWLPQPVPRSGPAVITVPIPGAHERPHEPEALAAVALGLGFTVETASGVPAALDRIRAREAGAQRVLICGSLYLAGHVLALQDGVQAQMN